MTFLIWGAMICSLPIHAKPCSFSTLPSDFSENYQKLFLFTSSLEVKTLKGIDECLRGDQRKFPWALICDDNDQFIEARATVFNSPKLEVVFNSDRELEINLQLQGQWDYSKVSSSEEAQVIIRPDKMAKIIYTTTSAKKIHLSFVTETKASDLTQLEVLAYKMAIGKPVLEDKYSCENL